MALSCLVVENSQMQRDTTLQNVLSCKGLFGVAYCGGGVHGYHDILIGLARLSDDIGDDLSLGILHNAGILGADGDGAGVLLAANNTDDLAGATVVNVSLCLYKDLHPLMVSVIVIWALHLIMSV